MCHRRVLGTGNGDVLRIVVLGVLVKCKRESMVGGQVVAVAVLVKRCYTPWP